MGLEQVSRAVAWPRHRDGRDGGQARPGCSGPLAPGRWSQARGPQDKAKEAQTKVPQTAPLHSSRDQAAEEGNGSTSGLRAVPTPTDTN